MPELGALACAARASGLWGGLAGARAHAPLSGRHAPRRAGGLAASEPRRHRGGRARTSPVLRCRQGQAIGRFDHIATGHGPAAGSCAVHPRDDDAGGRARCSGDVGRQGLHADSQISCRRDRLPRAAVPTSARTMADGTIARRPACSMTMPTSSPAVVNANEPGAMSLDGASVQIGVGPQRAGDRLEGGEEDRSQRDATGRRVCDHQKTGPLEPPGQPRRRRRHGRFGGHANHGAAPTPDRLRPRRPWLGALVRAQRASRRPQGRREPARRSPATRSAGVAIPATSELASSATSERFEPDLQL